MTGVADGFTAGVSISMLLQLFAGGVMRPACAFRMYYGRTTFPRHAAA